MFKNLNWVIKVAKYKSYWQKKKKKVQPQYLIFQKKLFTSSYILKIKQTYQGRYSCVTVH